MTQVLETPPKKAKEVSHRLDFRHAIKGSMYPPMAQYQLRAAAILGSEIPSFQCPNAQVNNKTPKWGPLSGRPTLVRK